MIERTGSRIALAFALIALLVTSGCELLTQPGNGTIVITLYSEFLESKIEDGTYADLPAAVDDYQIELAGLVQVDGLPAEAPEYYMGNAYGVITIPNVPPGSYDVHPVFMDPSLDITVVSTADETSEYEIIIPDLTVQGYLVNPSLENADFRRALAIGIDREELLTDTALAESADQDYAALYSALPSGLFRDSLYTTAEVTESIATAEGLFNDRTPVDLTILYNSNDTHSAVAGEISSQLDSAYPEIGTVTLDEQSWEEYQTKLAAVDYDLARIGWVFDSNNPFAWLKWVFENVGYTSTEYDQLVADIEAAIVGVDADTLLAYLDEAHTLLMDEGLFVPVYQY